MKFEPKPYTPEQASRMLGITVNEIYTLIRNRTINSYRSLKNAQCRIHGNDLNKYYENNQNHSKLDTLCLCNWVSIHINKAELYAITRKL